MRDPIQLRQFEFPEHLLAIGFIMNSIMIWMAICRRTTNLQSRVTQPEFFQGRTVGGNIRERCTLPSISRAGHLEILLDFYRQLESFCLHYCLCELLKMRMT